MNSSLQCFSQIYELHDYFLQNKFIKDINPDNPVGCGGYLAAAVAELLKDLWLKDEQSVAP